MSDAFGIQYGDQRYDGRELQPPPAVQYLANVGNCHKITDCGDLELTALTGGDLRRDATISSRATMRLLCRRGQWQYSPDFGSRLWTIKDLRQGRRYAGPYIREALQPLVDQGLISKIEIGQIETQSITGRLAVQVTIVVPELGPADLGLIPLGEL